MTDPSSAAERALSPLHLLYKLKADATTSEPRVEDLSDTTLPSPYHDLLVHKTNMTPKVAAFCKCDVGLRVVHSDESTENCVSRSVLLTNKNTGAPIELGMIVIHLSSLSPDVQTSIREGIVPLGTILLRAKVKQVCKPQMFFRVPNDPLLSSLLQVDTEGWLYGRCNRIEDESGALIAQVVEILPHFHLSPSSSSSSSSSSASSPSSTAMDEGDRSCGTETDDMESDPSSL